MEFREGLVADETQYLADRFDPAPRARILSREWARHPTYIAEKIADLNGQISRWP